MEHELLTLRVDAQALRKQFEQLAKDDMPMVRSAAFAHLPALAEVMYFQPDIPALHVFFCMLISFLGRWPA